MNLRARLIAAAFVPLVTVATALGCSGEDPSEAVEDARYELVDIVDFWGWAPRGRLEMSWQPGSGVERIAGGGPKNPREAIGESVAPDELALDSAARIHTDDAGGIWVLAYGAVVHLADGDINRVYDIGGASDVCAIAVDPQGRLAVTSGPATAVFDTNGGDMRYIRDRSSALRPNALAYRHDGTLIAGGSFDDLLVAVGTNGEDHGLLNQPSDPDTVAPPIAFVTVLSDDRIVVGSWASEHEMDISVVVDRALRPIGDGTGQPRQPEAITSLAPAPDGRLLVTTRDRVEAVDVDTGETETIVDLDGAAGTPSAAASGDDLVFLADGRLWRLPGAFA